MGDLGLDGSTVELSTPLIGYGECECTAHPGNAVPLGALSKGDLDSMVSLGALSRGDLGAGDPIGVFPGVDCALLEVL